MSLIFWGLLFILFEIEIGGFSIIPDFIGYILILLGMRKNEHISAYASGKTWAIAATVIAVLLWIPIWDDATLSVIGSLLGTLAHLGVTYKIMQGVEELTPNTMGGMSGIRKSWTVMAVSGAAMWALTLLTLWFGLIALIVNLVSGIIFIIMFYNFKKTQEY